jgi:bifunctional enzyme CysN/CysC
MLHPATRADASLDAHLAALARKSRLRFIACGSVDDGKSTLIGRLLYEANALFEDQLATLAAESQTFGTRGGDLDFALLTDGLLAEREQGITIDVAYRYFSTATRNFIVADAPGHEQYTRNMITAASTAELGLVLVDARKGVLTQTRRHTYLLTLLGVRAVVLAVNKMDLMHYAPGVFARIESEYRDFGLRIGLADITCIPISAVDGDNVSTRSGAMSWYQGPTLLDHLNGVEIGDDLAARPFRLPVQRIVRPSQDFRGIAGLIAGGRIALGDEVTVLPSGRRSRVSRILVGDLARDSAIAGQSVTIGLASHLDVSRGDVVASGPELPGVADQFQATVIWLHDQPMLPGRSYVVKAGAQTVTATVAPLRYKINVNTLEQVAARHLDGNDIGACDIETNRPIVFERYEDNRDLGGVVLIDPLTNETVGAGLLQAALRRFSAVAGAVMDVDKDARAALKRHRPCVIWLTGLPGSGKSTIANLVERRLHALGHHTYLLDADHVRHGLNKDLRFSDADRVENIRRAAEVAALMVDAGLIVIVAFVSPFRAEREAARTLADEGEFCEIFLDIPLHVAEARDTKGVFEKARRGELSNVTGIDSPYEPPERPELHIDTASVSAEAAAEGILAYLQKTGVIPEF